MAETVPGVGEFMTPRAPPMMGGMLGMVLIRTVTKNSATVTSFMRAVTRIAKTADGTKVMTPVVSRTEESTERVKC